MDISYYYYNSDSTHEQESLGSNGFKVTHFTIRPYKNAKLTQQEQKCGTGVSSAGDSALGRVLIRCTIWSWKHTHFGNSWCMTRICSLRSLFFTLISLPGLSLHSFDDFPWFSSLSLTSYPLKKTAIGSPTEEDIIYLRLLFKSYKIPGFILYTEKQSNTSAGNRPSWWKDTPVQTACFTYLTHKGCQSKGGGWRNSLLCGPRKDVYS